MMNTISANTTISNGQKGAEDYILALYNVFLILSSLVGDTLILYASFQRGAFKLHKNVVIVMRYIAVTDLTSVISGTIPAVITWLANEWVLGDVICHIQVYIGVFSLFAGYLLVAVLTSTKFFTLKFPLRAGTWTRKMAHLVCCLPLIIPLIQSVLLILDGGDTFDSRVHLCTPGFTASFWKIAAPLFGFFMIFIPNLVVVSTTILILHYAISSAQRVHESVKWQETLAVVLTAVVYLTSTLPIFVYHTAKDYITHDQTGTFHFHFYRLAYEIMGLNLISNFYIYTLMLRSFRGFLKSKILSLYSSLQATYIPTSGNNPSTGEY